MQNNVSMPRNMRWVILAALLLIIFQSTRSLPLFYLDEMRFDMASDYVWYIGINSGVLPITLRIVLSYLRWLPLFILGGSAMVLAVQQRRMPRAVHRADAYIVAFLIFTLVSCLYSINSSISFMRAVSVILMYGAVFWGVWIYADEFGVEAVASIIITASAIVFGLHIIDAIVDPIGSFPYLGRFRGWMVNPGTAAGYAAVLLPLTLWIASQKSRWQYWLLVGVMLFVLIMSQTRTEIVAATIGSMYFLVRTYPKRIYISLLSTISVLAVSYLWIEAGPRLFPIGTDFKLDNADDIFIDNNLEFGQEQNDIPMLEPWYKRFNPRTNDAKTLAHRTEKWRMGLEYFLERPLQGFGFGTEDQLFAYHDVNLPDYQLSGAYMHNSYLGLVLQVGIIGAALFYVPLASLILYELLAVRNTRNTPLFTALLSVVLTCMIAGMFSSDLYSMGNAKSFVFWISVMLLVRANNTSKDIHLQI